MNMKIPIEDMTKVAADKPMGPPDAQVTEIDDSPKFGRLLIALFLAVMLIVGITFGSEAFFTP